MKSVGANDIGQRHRSKQTFESIRKRAESLLESEKLYLDYSLTEDQLAEEIGITRSWLSKALNGTGIKFRDLVGAYRTNYAIMILNKSNNAPENRKLILDYALESGFASERQLNKHLKIMTGKTASKLM